MASLVKPIYEFVLWDNCSNNCSFCFQKHHFTKSSDEDKLIAINNTLEFLRTRLLSDFHVLLVGGEIFDTTSTRVQEAFLNLTDHILCRMIIGEIEYLYINTNLMYDPAFLESFIQQVGMYGMWSRLKFTTSDDIVGRFSSEERKQLFNQNIQWLHDTYPKVNVVVNTILTSAMCDEICDKRFSQVKHYRDLLGYDVNLIPYMTIDDKLTAPREKIFRALKTEDELNPGYLRRYIDNFDLPQKKLVYKHEGGSLNLRSEDYAKCGHCKNFQHYSSSGTCFICDLKELFG